MKQVGKVSVEWLAGEKTKVVGTFPPRTQGWTGYVEKDTAGQKNIYSVEVISNFKIAQNMLFSLIDSVIFCNMDFRSRRYSC